MQRLSTARSLRFDARLPSSPRSAVVDAFNSIDDEVFERIAAEIR
jgi:hypothetical protein